MIQLWWSDVVAESDGYVQLNSPKAESERKWWSEQTPKNYKINVALARLKILELLFGNPKESFILGDNVGGAINHISEL